MAFLDIVKELITNKPANLKSPYFAKADSDLKAHLETLIELNEHAPANIKLQIEQDIRNLEAGRIGEENVAFELNNSFMPIIVLHDLNLEHEGLKAQIDFMVITAKVTLIIECKNLYGDIEVNSNGDFIRTTTYKGKTKREGIYSPITQNDRHMELIKAVRRTAKSNFLLRTFFDKNFEENYKSVVVLANPKTVIDLKKAKKEVKNKIIRCDQLVDYMKKLYKESKNEPSFEKHMFELAEYFISLHKPNKTDYLKKYGDIMKPDDSAITSTESLISEDIENTPIFIELKNYRLETSRAEGIKAFYIFSNAQLLDLLKAMPKTIDDLMKVKGFSEVKCQKYGDSILEIIKKYE
jgi:hypothetical protein